MIRHGIKTFIICHTCNFQRSTNAKFEHVPTQNFYTKIILYHKKRPIQTSHFYPCKYTFFLLFRRGERSFPKHLAPLRITAISYRGVSGEHHSNMIPRGETMRTTEKVILNLVNSNRIWIEITLHRLI